MNKAAKPVSTPARSQQQIWAGPLPDPAALERFGKIIPNGAERIVRMAELEQAHRFETERANNEIQKRVLEENIANTIREQYVIRLGIWLGWLLSVGSVVSALVSVHLGAHWSVSAALYLPHSSVFPSWVWCALSSLESSFLSAGSRQINVMFS